MGPMPLFSKADRKINFSVRPLSKKLCTKNASTHVTRIDGGMQTCGEQSLVKGRGGQIARANRRDLHMGEHCLAVAQETQRDSRVRSQGTKR